MIPRTLHFVWVGDNPMPDWGRANIERFRALNPGFTVRIHGDEALLAKYRLLYDRLTEPAQRADILRLSVLQSEGGWYWDCDFYPFRPVDDLERAYALDGSTMFVSRQQGNLNDTWTHANAPMCATPDWPGWPLIDEILASRTFPVKWCDFGPAMIKESVAKSPALFTVGAAPWLFPAGIGRAGAAYHRMLAAGSTDLARRLSRDTGGQLPFAMHLWAGGKPTIPNSSQCLYEAAPEAGSGNGRRAVFALIDQQWTMDWQPFPSMAEGLRRLGWCVEVRRVDDPDVLTYADLVVVWNGRKFKYKKVADRAKAEGIPVLYVEHGFFDRRAYVQVDHAGILHWASWAHAETLLEPAPADGMERLRRVWPHDLIPVTRRQQPDVLVIGQVDGDSQLDECQIQTATELERLVSRVPGVNAVFRDHPLAPDRPPHTRRLRRHDGLTLAQAAERARVAVMLNSNSGNELLALGVPVLALGPAIYTRAGVATRFKQSELAELLHKPPIPDQAAVENYLCHLACRQYSHDDLRDGWALEKILQEAGL